MYITQSELLNNSQREGRLSGQATMAWVATDARWQDRRQHTLFVGRQLAAAPGTILACTLERHLSCTRSYSGVLATRCKHTNSRRHTCTPVSPTAGPPFLGRIWNQPRCCIRPPCATDHSTWTSEQPGSKLRSRNTFRPTLLHRSTSYQTSSETGRYSALGSHLLAEIQTLESVWYPTQISKTCHANN